MNDNAEFFKIGWTYSAVVDCCGGYGSFFEACHIYWREVHHPRWTAYFW